MAQPLPYLPSYKNVGKLFEKILTAQKPDSFTHEYLRDTIGLKGTGDRALISFLRALGFLDTGNRPTENYDLLKNQATAKAAIANRPTPWLSMLQPIQRKFCCPCNTP
jgi:hypothetical protein